MAPEFPLTRRTGRWRGLTAVTFLFAGVGALAARPGLLLAAAVPLVLAAVVRGATPPAVDLTVERTLSDDAPDPGGTVEVEVRVTNAGDALADLRLLDGVPTALTVEGGSARHGTALRPGRSTSFTYTLTAQRGRHEFDDAVAVARDPTGAAERRVEVAVESAAQLVCRPPLPAPVALPLRATATGVTGETTTGEGGAGLAFHSVREYRRGDPLARIAWSRTARTGDLRTVEFHRERSATVCVVVDAREAAYVAPTADDPPALERGIEAAGSVLRGRLDAGDRVGLAALGPTPCWLEPATGADHRVRARDHLATHPAFSPVAPDDPFFPTLRLARLRRRLPAGAQVVFCTPLTDDYALRAARRLDAAGHPVTVVSPDPTAADSTGERLARLERSLRASTLREAGLPVVDWRDGSFRAAVEHAARRWSA
ncbi:DUF58 domain-containing protein [Halomarina ordinaria]|uniref:DUF58 domain-containing protein n=1 Tax=Halomarina ordinaria TaxID=3033939 RepID=A0ABD5U8T7_9EURY|nr:DUF58 domain-containing protein [Halomarina sp. PSRA2]